MAEDATLEFLDQLRDESRWVIRRGVPIYAPNKSTFVRADGKSDELVTTKADLEKIVARYQRQFDSYGVVPRLTLGHVKRLPHADERIQPKIVGYAVNLRTGTFGPAGDQPAVLADLYYRREDYDEAKGFPYRSAEYFPNLNEISGVALLRQDPRLDLGILAFDRGSEPRIYFSMRNDMDPTLAPQANAAAAGPQAPEGVDPAFFAMFAKCFQAMQSQMAPVAPVAPAPVQNAAFPSATNASPPAPAKDGDGDGTVNEDEKKDKQDNARSGEALQFARLQADLAKERAERLNFQRQIETEKAERVADQLEAAGYQFNRVKFVGNYAKADDAGRAAEINDVRQFSRQAPIGPMVPVVRGAVLPGGGKPEVNDEPSERQMDAAFDFMRADPTLDYDAALAKAKAKVK